MYILHRRTCSYSDTHNNLTLTHTVSKHANQFALTLLPISPRLETLHQDLFLVLPHPTVHPLPSLLCEYDFDDDDENEALFFLLFT